MLKGLADVKYGQLWLDVEGQSDYWSSNKAANTAFIKVCINREKNKDNGPLQTHQFQAMVEELKSNKKSVGMYTSASQWGPITENSNDKEFADLPLWYFYETFEKIA